MKKINNYIHVCLILLTTLILGSCKDSFLEPKALSFFAPENTYKDKAAMVTLLNDCRYRLKQEFINDNPLLCSEYNVSDIAVPGETASQSLKDLNKQLTPLGAGNSKILDNSDSPGETSYWAVCWASIKSATVVISRHDKAQYESERDKNEILSEGYFHHAYWYYRIVHQYGDVPYLDEEITTPRVDLMTASRKYILNKIKTNMEFAVQWLPLTVKRGEVSSAAAYHLLAKIYLALGEFDNAITATTEVIEKSGLALMRTRFGVDRNNANHDVVWDLFRKENISIAENVEGVLIAQDQAAFAGTASSSTGTIRTRSYGPFWTGITGMIRTPGNAQYVYLLRGIARTRPTGYMCFGIWSNSEGDLRHTWPNWYPMDSLKWNNPSVPAKYGKYVTKAEAIADGDTLRRYYPFQYYKIVVPDNETIYNPLTSNDARGGFSDIYIFRLAETYLLRAEAYYWKGNLTSAAADINQIRGRAQAPLIQSSDVTIDYILDERARELYVEEPRKTELTRVAFIMADANKDGYTFENITTKNFYYDRVMRTNNFFSTQFVAGGIPFTMSPYHFLWPIPDREIKANVNGHINQNKGYSGSDTNITPIEN